MRISDCGLKKTKAFWFSIRILHSAFRNRPVCPVLFPTFALKYHVPFRNKTEATERLAPETSVQAALFIFGAIVYRDGEPHARQKYRHVVCSVAAGVNEFLYLSRNHSSATCKRARMRYYF